MDFLLLIAGWIMLYRRNYPWLFAIIIVLCSTYLQLPIEEEISNSIMIGPVHNVGDSGLLLYLSFFLVEVARKGVRLNHPMAKVVCLFLLFLFLNGLIDILNGVALGDVVRYWRNWTLMTIVFLPSCFNINDIKKTCLIIFWMTFVLSIVLSLQYLLGADEWMFKMTSYGEHVRGAKPPSTAIICFCLALLNVFKFSSKVRILTCVVLALPVMFCMKMSYFTTICLTLLVCYRLMNANIQKLLKYGIGFAMVLLVLFSVFPVFTERFEDTVNQSGMTHNVQKKGNFIYRINHFKERFNCVMENPMRSVRGLGYVQEQNYHGHRFKYAIGNHLGGKAMIDTADIAWSPLIIRLGLLGIFIYLVMYAKCLRCLWRDRKKDYLTLTYFSYTLVALFFMSFGNALIADSDFFIIPFLLINTDYEDSTLHLGT